MADFPDITPDETVDWRIETNTAEFSSDLNMAVQHMVMQGARWRGTLPFTNRKGVDARRLKAFVFSQQGPAGRFDVLPPDLNQQGTMSGSGTVDGTGQTGTTLNTTDWDASQPVLFDYGDYFEVNGELKMITEPVASDASGDATLTFVPPLRESPTSGQSIEVTEPRARNCYLLNDDQAAASISGPYIYSLRLEIVEDVT